VLSHGRYIPRRPSPKRLRRRTIRTPRTRHAELSFRDRSRKYRAAKLAKLGANKNAKRTAATAGRHETFAYQSMKNIAAALTQMVTTVSSAPATDPSYCLAHHLSARALYPKGKWQMADAKDTIERARPPVL
jgi:hypothetical protein